MNRSDLLLRKRNAPEQRQKRGCRGSTELPIVVPRRSWREISCGKLGTLIQQTKNSLNFVSTCLKVVDTRRAWVNLEQHPFIVTARSVEQFSGRLFVRMDYIAPDVRGRVSLLDHLVQARGPIDTDRALR